MTVKDAYDIIGELRGRFDAPFSSSDKSTIESLYYEVTGKVFVATGCQQCYHDGLLEVYSYLKKNGKMAEKCNYRMLAGAIISCPEFQGGKIFTNDNLTDEVAKEYLEIYPMQEEMFQKIPDTEEAPMDDASKDEDGTKGAPKKDTKVSNADKA